MSYTKRQLIVAAFTEIGLGSYDFDLSTDQIDQALQRLDAMVAQWSARGIRLGYPIPSSPELSDATQDTGLPMQAAEVVIANLAIRLAPSYGKAAPSDTRALALDGFNALLSVAAFPEERRIQDLPSGAGAKSVDEPFLPVEEDAALAPPEPSATFQ